MNYMSKLLAITKSIWRALLTIAFCSFAVSIASAASFDCGKALTAVEKMICVVDSPLRLGELDEEMLGTYRYVLSLTRDPKKLKQDQREWIKSRNRCADEMCLKKSYRLRVDELVEIVKRYEEKTYKEEPWAENQKKLIIKNRNLGFCKKIAELYALGKLDSIIPTDNTEAFKAKYNNIDIDSDGINDHILVEGGVRESLMTIRLSSGAEYEGNDVNSTRLVNFQSKVYVLNYSPFIDNISEKTYLESVDWLSPNGVARVCEYKDIQR